MRALHWIYAALGGYFWKRCERCGKGWGGHQWRSPAQSRPIGYHQSIAAYCPKCAHN